MSGGAGECAGRRVCGQTAVLVVAFEWLSYKIMVAILSVDT